MPRSWLETLTFVVPALVILLVATLEIRRWLERRRRDREMAQALRGFLERHRTAPPAEAAPPLPPAPARPEAPREQQQA